VTNDRGAFAVSEVVFDPQINRRKGPSSRKENVSPREPVGVLYSVDGQSKIGGHMGVSKVLLNFRAPDDVLFYGAGTNDHWHSSVNGNRQQTNNFTLDRQDLNEAIDNTISYTPNREAIGEVKIISGNGQPNMATQMAVSL